MLPKVPTIITIVSIIPFVLLSVLTTFHLFEEATLLNLMVTYAAIMLSFLAGTPWGIAIDHQNVHNKVANQLYMLSTGMVLLAWMVLLIPDVLTQMLCLTVLFTIAWGIDSMLHNYNIVPLWFFTIRSIVTPIVIVSIYVSYFSIL